VPPAPYRFAWDVNAVEAECIFVNNAIEARISRPANRLSSFRLTAPVTKSAEQIDHEALEGDRRHLSHTIKKVGPKCAGERLVASPELFLRSFGGFVQLVCAVFVTWLRRTWSCASPAPFDIAREAFEKRHIYFGRLLGKV
jgi:hypothetical protein